MAGFDVRNENMQKIADALNDSHTIYIFPHMVAAGAGEGGAVRERPKIRGLLHHDGKNTPVAVPRPDKEGRADGMAAAGAGRAGIQRRTVFVPSGGDDLHDARYRV